MAERTVERQRLRARGAARRWVLAAALGLGLALAALRLPASRAALVALFLLPDALGLPLSPLAWLSWPPDRSEVTYPYGPGRAAVADLYRPRGGLLDLAALPPWPAGRAGLVLFAGIATPKSYPPLARLGEALARAGVVVLVPESPTMLDGQVDSGEVDGLVVAAQLLAARPGVHPCRLAFAGFSVGGSLSLVAAADPRIRERVVVVNTLGAYADARELLVAILSWRAPARPGAALQAWEPDPLARRVAYSALQMALAAEREGGGDGADVAFSTVQLLQALEDGTPLSPSAAAAAIAGLPREGEQELAALSPVQVAGQLQAAVLLMHDAADAFVPPVHLTELSRTLAAAGRAPQRATRLASFTHALPQPGLAPWSALIEHARLLSHLYALMRWLV